MTAFGTPVYGSDAGRLSLGNVAVGMACDPVSGGYWILTSAGRIHAFHAPWLGSLVGKIPVGAAVTAIAADRGGYLVLTSAGQVYEFTPGP